MLVRTDCYSERLLLTFMPKATGNPCSCVLQNGNRTSICGEVHASPASLPLAFAECNSRACPNTWLYPSFPPLCFFLVCLRVCFCFFRSGASKQFANLCGIFFASVSWACLVGDKSIGARIMLVSCPRLLVAVADKGRCCRANC